MQRTTSYTNLWRTIGIFVLLNLLCDEVAFTQHKLADTRLSPKLAQKINGLADDQRISVMLTCKTTMVPEALKNMAANLRQLHVTGHNSFFMATLPVSVLRFIGERFPEIIFIEDGTRKPKEELFVANLDKSVNAINVMHRRFPQWNGSGVTLSVKEDMPDTADIDFKGRFLTTSLSSPFLSSHATIMATMAAGGGNSWHLGKGVAWGSRISSSDFSTLLPDDSASYRQYDISVQNHSYGVGIENYYGGDAAAYDAISVDNPFLLHVFSAGNEGLVASDAGTYAGIAGFANLTGSFKMAKNILTVAATDSFNVVPALSSKGPAYDGRVKPELVAFGEDGSSGAAALISGAALVLQQQYKSKHGVLPPNALLRAILVNSADKPDNAALDYETGFGSLNALKAVVTIEAGRYFSGDLSNGQGRFYTISIPPGLRKLKVTLTWNDPPAVPGTDKALVNDLDMELINNLTGEKWNPWVLNNFPHPDSLRQPAVRKRDSLNNTERITLDNPSAGDYIVSIKAFSFAASHQDFYIAYQFDSADVFEWMFPTRDDFLFTSSVNVIRWHSSYNAGRALLEYSVNNGDTWEIINDSVPLAEGYCRWHTPGNIEQVQLRMTIGSTQFVSDTFTISQRTQTGVGFDCTDSFLIYWNKLPQVSTYKIYDLGEKYLEPLMATTNDFAVIAKNGHPSFHYAVSPVIGDMEGVKSYTFNYSDQGAGCYFRTFFALLEGNYVTLQLSLGTLYGLKSIVPEKWNGSNFIAMEEITVINSLEFVFRDSALRNGANSYRVRLTRSDGQIAYSSVETVYYFPKAPFIAYPNPVSQNQSLNILAEEPGVVLQVINSIGQKIAEYKIVNTLTSIPASRFAKGLYFCRFIKDGVAIQTVKIIVQ